MLNTEATPKLSVHDDYWVYFTVDTKCKTCDVSLYLIQLIRRFNALDIIVQKMSNLYDNCFLILKILISNNGWYKDIG